HGHTLVQYYVSKLDLLRRSGTLADGSGRLSARSRACPLTVRCARYSGASDGAVRSGWDWEFRGSARLTNILSGSEREGRTHNATPVSYRTRALARVRLAL